MIKPSSEVFAQSMISNLLSKETPPEARALYQHRVTGLCEFGLMKGTCQTVAKNILKIVGLTISTKGQICADKFSLSYKRELDLPWLPFTLEPFKRLIRLCLGSIAFALMVLVVGKVLSEHLLEGVYLLSARKAEAF